MMFDKTALTLALAMGLIFAGGLLRPPSPVSGVPPEQFWNHKLLWGPDHDVILAGDSRTFQGLSPAKMAETLHGRRIVNFGFATCGMTPFYLHAAQALLDPASPDRALVLGVTPHSLTPNAARENELVARWTQIRPWHPALIARQWDNEFLSLRSQERMGVQLGVWLGPMFHFFRPYQLGEWQAWWHDGKTGYFQHYYPDGWVASRQIPENHQVMEGWARRIFEGNQVSPQVVDGFIDTVSQIASKGIRVYGFLFPTAERTASIEAERSGFREAPIAGRFRIAGGVWLNLPSTAQFASHDGNHLREDGALELSRVIAEAIGHSEARAAIR